MKECEKALGFCPMLGYTSGSHIQLAISAQEHGFRSGWRAALEWVRDNNDGYCCGKFDAGGEWHECPRYTIIKQELEN